MSSLWRFKSVNTARASGSVSSTVSGSSTPAFSASMRKKPMSKDALCAQTTCPRQNSASAGITSPTEGAPATMSSVMLCTLMVSGGMRMPGLTMVWYSSTILSSMPILTAAISMMRSLPACRPVVSMSSTTYSRPMGPSSGLDTMTPLSSMRYPSMPGMSLMFLPLFLSFLMVSNASG